MMTEITVDLVPLPRSTGLALLQFDDLYAALLAVPAILETGPLAVELLDTLSLTLCRNVPEYARLLASVVEGTRTACSSWSIRERARRPFERGSSDWQADKAGVSGRYRPDSRALG